MLLLVEVGYFVMIFVHGIGFSQLLQSFGHCCSGLLTLVNVLVVMEEDLLLFSGFNCLEPDDFTIVVELSSITVTEKVY